MNSCRNEEFVICDSEERFKWGKDTTIRCGRCKDGWNLEEQGSVVGRVNTVTRV